MFSFANMYLTKREHHLDKETNIMKNYILATILLSISSFSFDAAADYVEHYSIEQKHITVKVAPTSGLPKVLCDYYSKGGKHIAKRISTVSENYDDTYIIETLLSAEDHAKVYKIKCK